jgi:hypothetical protein
VKGSAWHELKDPSAPRCLLINPLLPQRGLNETGPRLYRITAVALAATRSPPDAQPVDGDEQRLWLRAEAEQKVINESGFLYEDADLEVYLNEVARKLQSPDDLAGLPVKILVLKDPHLNAFAFPNGVIYLHSGLLARMDNEAQLAALRGHEITHCTHQHALRLRSLRTKVGQHLAGTLRDGSGSRVDLLSILDPQGSCQQEAIRAELEAKQMTQIAVGGESGLA